ncbi:hypothetical protein MBLNU13_g02735t2 [Cladosporium sp. NU13]
MSLEKTVTIRSVHNYAGITGCDSASQHNGDNIVINQTGFNIHTDAHDDGRIDFIGHYSSAALHPVASYVARPELQAQIEQRLHDTVELRGGGSKVLIVCGLGGDMGNFIRRNVRSPPRSL